MFKYVVITDISRPVLLVTIATHLTTPCHEPSPQPSFRYIHTFRNMTGLNQGPTPTPTFPDSVASAFISYSGTTVLRRLLYAVRAVTVMMSVGRSCIDVANGDRINRVPQTRHRFHAHVPRCSSRIHRDRKHGKIGPVVSAENRLTNGNCAATRLQSDDCRPFVTLAFENESEYWNSDFSVFIGHQFSTLCKILVRFGSVTPEFKT